MSLVLRNGLIYNFGNSHMWHFRSHWQSFCRFSVKTCCDIFPMSTGHPCHFLSCIQITELWFYPTLTTLIFRKNMGDIEAEKGEQDSATAHTVTPVANLIIFEAPNGWFSSRSISPPGAPHQWLPALKGKAIIDLGHRQREGQNCSAQHNQL